MKRFIVLKDKNVMVILCGSRISTMMTQVLSYSSPLYGKRTAQIRLSPLKFMDIMKSNTNKSFEQLVEVYSVTGVVPKYFDFFDNDEPLIENIEREVLQKGGFLKSQHKRAHYVRFYLHDTSLFNFPFLKKL